MITEIPDNEIVELFRKYEKDIFNKLNEQAKEKGYEIGDQNKIDLVDLMFCMMIENDYMDSVIENMEDSIGVGEYGFIVVDED